MRATRSRLTEPTTVMRGRATSGGERSQIVERRAEQRVVEIEEPRPQRRAVGRGIEPGSIRSEGLAELGEERIQTMIKNIPIGSLGEPEDIGYAAVFLASDAARFITGQTIVVDGGQTLPEIPQ